MRTSSFRDLLSETYNTAETTMILLEMEKMDVRSSVIVGSVLVENSLRLLISTKLEQVSNREAKNIFEDNGVLHSFHSKNVIAYSLGLIGEKTQKEINVVKKIRNAFAHSARAINFEDRPVSDELCKIMELKSIVFGDIYHYKNNIEKFYSLCKCITQNITAYRILEKFRFGFSKFVLEKGSEEKAMEDLESKINPEFRKFIIGNIRSSSALL